MQADDAAFVLPIEIGQDRLADRRDVLLPLPKWGQSDMKYVQSIKEVLTQTVILDGLLGTSIGGGDHSHVDRQLGLGAQPAHLSIFQYAKEFRLGCDWHFGNFIEQDGSIVGLLKAACAACDGPCECPLLVAEQFAFYQCLRHCRAVNCDEGTGRPRTEAMQSANDQFFPCPA